MAAIDLRRLRRITTWCRALLGSLLAGSSTVHAATLPEDKAELLWHRYDGGGVQASGPALLVRKSLLGSVSLSAQSYVDMVSNASVDVMTQASPFRETRKAWELGAQTAVRDSTLGIVVSRSNEPDYQADAVAIDATTEVFGGMSTVSLGTTRGSDRVGRSERDAAGNKATRWLDTATHWQYRVGLTQVLSPRWLVSISAEAVADSGYLGSPYRAARVFGASVPERSPRTRSSRAVQLRSSVDTSDIWAGSALRASVRGYDDNWAIRATTFEIGGSKQLLSAVLPRGLLLDATLRHYRQGRALFYSDNASSETLYISRNRQLSAFSSTSLGARLNYAWPDLPPGRALLLSAGYEFKRFSFNDYTDLRTGQAYAHDAHILQLALSANF